MTIDVVPLSDDELATLRVAVVAEQERRLLVAGASQRISQINQECMVAQGVTEGAGWVQPTDASNAYPAGWKVSYNGQTWLSLIPSNTTKPGDAADPQNYRWWRNLTEAPPAPPSGPAAWDGAGHAYAVADQVAYQGKTYRCVQAHTSQPGWTPTAVPALWAVVP